MTYTNLCLPLMRGLYVVSTRTRLNELHQSGRVIR